MLHVEFRRGPRFRSKTFVLYVNDIYNVSKLVKSILFADNKNTFCVGNNLLELRDILNRELAKLCINHSLL